MYNMCIYREPFFLKYIKTFMHIYYNIITDKYTSQHINNNVGYYINFSSMRAQITRKIIDYDVSIIRIICFKQTDKSFKITQKYCTYVFLTLYFNNSLSGVCI